MPAHETYARTDTDLIEDHDGPDNDWSSPNEDGMYETTARESDPRVRRSTRDVLSDNKGRIIACTAAAAVIIPLVAYEVGYFRGKDTGAEEQAEQDQDALAEKDEQIATLEGDKAVLEDGNMQYIHLGSLLSDAGIEEAMYTNITPSSPDRGSYATLTIKLNATTPAYKPCYDRGEKTFDVEFDGKKQIVYVENDMKDAAGKVKNPDFNTQAKASPQGIEEVIGKICAPPPVK